MEGGRCARNATESAAEWRAWFDAACDADAMRSRRTFLMTDSAEVTERVADAFLESVRSNPLLAAARGRHHIVAPYARHSMKTGNHSFESVWKDSLVNLAIDFHLSSMATEIQSQALSSFVTPIAGRSVCIRRLRWLERGEWPLLMRDVERCRRAGRPRGAARGRTALSLPVRLRLRETSPSLLVRGGSPVHCTA